MDKLNRYREILRQVLAEYAEWSGGEGITAEVIEDPKRDHFELLRFGWERGRHVHGTILHADIIDGKIWIQYDGTNRPLAEELLAAGITKEEIVLGDRSPRRRAMSGFAVG
jgi:hypothetical protein